MLNVSDEASLRSSGASRPAHGLSRNHERNLHSWGSAFRSPEKMLLSSFLMVLKDRKPAETTPPAAAMLIEPPTQPAAEDGPTSIDASTSNDA